ncbi:Sel1 domain protein repeat-containing protein [Thiorhodococcus drewsii AZ1]|uniref:Sel1 domain protein repeat-containing protein n=2 Tax=Thiorhodococcus drewsii TaxID=210408 RepID=G2DWT8_9GAMM|nr:Sel1 domain protein repeat-containing protein [Thiorhodococcus drewsii AZ1]
MELTGHGSAGFGRGAERIHGSSKAETVRNPVTLSIDPILSPFTPIEFPVSLMSDNSYLKDLILLRNDPSKVETIRAAAERGELDALYAMGLICAEGRGVSVDLAQAHYWLSLAIERGDRDAVRLREIVGSQMSDEEYAVAKRLRAAGTLGMLSSDRRH